MKVATLTTVGQEIKIESPYDGDAVQAIKGIEGRRWDAASKAWFVPADAKAEAVEVVGKFFKVVDADRQNVKMAKIDALMEEVAENQKYILDSQERIEAIIEDLSGSISRYSYNSSSNIKAGKIQDRALLQHSLDNARLDSSKMTELQIKGLAAAVRYLEG